MRLADLEPMLVRIREPGHYAAVDALAEAQGVMFLCPACYQKNGGPVGTHSVLCWFRGRGVPDEEKPGPGRWDPSGEGLKDLTLSPSVDLTKGGPGCTWHGWVKGGDAS